MSDCELTSPVIQCWDLEVYCSLVLNHMAHDSCKGLSCLIYVAKRHGKQTKYRMRTVDPRARNLKNDRSTHPYVLDVRMISRSTSCCSPLKTRSAISKRLHREEGDPPFTPSRFMVFVLRAVTTLLAGSIHRWNERQSVSCQVEIDIHQVVQGD